MWRSATRRGAPAEAARRRELTIGAYRRGPALGSSDGPECCPTKSLQPDRTRELVREICANYAVSVRRACSVPKFDCSRYHDSFRRTDPAELKRTIWEICETRLR